MEILDAYNLTREDWTSLNELAQLKGMPDPTKDISSKTKSSFTRSYNQGTHMRPFVQASDSGKKKKADKLVLPTMEGEDAADLSSEAEGEEGEEDDSASMVKQTKGGASTPAANVAGKGKSSSKGNSKGKGK